MSFLGDDWQAGADGLRFRNASRVLIFDNQRRLLLAQGHDLDNPGRQWWFTIGGGCEPGENAREAGRRELYEETGIHLPIEALTGPVMTRAAVFDFAAETVRQYEVFFAAWLDDAPAINTAGWSHLEKQMIDSLRWWTIKDLLHTKEQIYPVGLGEYALSLMNGWDGTVTHLGDVRDPN